MRVLELWRYPVKSMLGESLDEALVTPAGITGDRRFALVDGATGEALTARDDPQLLFATARIAADGSLSITLPDGARGDDDRALSAWLGRPVRLRESTPGPAHSPGRYDGYFHDDSEAHVSLISTATVGAWAPARFRSNVLLDGTGEDDLVGIEIGLGDARLSVGFRIDRCVMTTRAQPGIDRDNQVLRMIHRERGGALAVGAIVVRPGVVRIGDLLSSAGGPPR